MDGKNLGQKREGSGRRGTYSGGGGGGAGVRWELGRRPGVAPCLGSSCQGACAVPRPAALARALARTHCCRVEKACQTTAVATTMDART